MAFKLGIWVVTDKTHTMNAYVLHQNQIKTPDLRPRKYACSKKTKQNSTPVQDRQSLIKLVNERMLGNEIQSEQMEQTFYRVQLSMRLFIDISKTGVQRREM